MIPDLKNLLFHINYKAFIVVFFSLFLLASCGAKKIIATNSDNYPPKLIFLNYHIKTSLDGEKSIHFINKIITDGQLKTNSNKYIEHGAPGDLECRQLDKNSNTLQKVIIKNPLKKHLEYLADSLNFQTKLVELNSTSFGLKLKLNPNTKYVAINEILENEKTSNPLIKTKLY